MKHIAFIGLGSNLGDAHGYVMQAMQTLKNLPSSQLVSNSSLYRSAPVGYLDQPDFINAVVQLKTNLAPLDLLQRLLAIERASGRQRQFRNAPRTLDMDVLLYDDMQHNESGLNIPHPQMHLRAFVLRPLLEIAPDCKIPGIGTVAKALLNCRDQQVEKLVHAIHHAIQ